MTMNTADAMKSNIGSQPSSSMRDMASAADSLVKLVAAGGTLATALNITERECEALYTLGRRLYEQGKYAQGIPVFAQLVAYNHLEPRYLAAFGAALQMLRRYEDALCQYMAVMVIALDDPAPALHSAECLIAMGKKAEAEESLELAIALCDHDRHDAMKEKSESLLRLLKAPVR